MILASRPASRLGRGAAPLVLAAALSLGLAAAPAAAQERVEDPVLLQIYDVADLHHEGPTAPGASDEDRAARDEAIAADHEELAALLREHITPPLEGPSQALRAVRGGTLVGSLTMEQHGFVRRFLELQRDLTDAVFDVQLRMISVPTGDPLLEVLEEQELTIDDLTLELVLRAAQKTDVDILTAPRILLAPRAPAEISVMETIAYVADYELHENVYPDGRTLAVPIVSQIEDGIRIDTRVTPIAPGQSLIDLEVLLREVERPIPSLETSLGVDGLDPVTVYLPVWGQSRVETKVLLGDDETALIATGGFEDRQMFVLLRSQLVTPEALTPDELQGGPSAPGQPADDQRKPQDGGRR